MLSLLDKQREDRTCHVVDVWHAATILGTHIDVLKRALGGEKPDELLMRALAQVATSDRIAIREAEWEINKQLRSPKQ